jgi:hypothetical protein
MARAARDDRARREHGRVRGPVVRAALLGIGLVTLVTLLALVLGGPLADGGVETRSDRDVMRLDTST